MSDHPRESRYESRYDDEISLIDIWLTLVRRKWWIVATAVLVITLAIGHIVITPPVYQSRGVVEVGMADGEPLQETASLVARLEQQHGSGPLPRIDRIERDGRLLALIGRGHDPEGARRVVEQVMGGLVDRHDELYRDYRAALENRMQSLDTRIALLETQLDTLSARIEGMDGEGMAASLLTLEQRLSTQLPNLETERYQIARQLGTRRTQPTEVIQVPERRENPVEPRVQRIMALAVILGLMLGMFVAFFAELVATARKQSP